MSLDHRYPYPSAVDGHHIYFFVGACPDGVGRTPENKYEVFVAQDSGELWRYDANPPEYRFDEQGKPRKYATFDGPSEPLIREASAHP